MFFMFYKNTWHWGSDVPTYDTIRSFPLALLAVILALSVIGWVLMFFGETSVYNVVLSVIAVMLCYNYFCVFMGSFDLIHFHYGKGEAESIFYALLAAVLPLLILIYGFNFWEGTSFKNSIYMAERFATMVFVPWCLRFFIARKLEGLETS